MTTTISGHDPAEVARNRARQPAEPFQVPDDLDGLATGGIVHNAPTIREGDYATGGIVHNAPPIREEPRPTRRRPPSPSESGRTGRRSIVTKALAGTGPARAWAARAASRGRTAIMTTAGLGSISWAAYLTDARLGFLAAGVSLLTLEHLSADG